MKSNIGHTQAAAGVAGVIKMVMAMRHGVLPRDAARRRAVAARGLGGRRGGAADRGARRGRRASRPRRAGVSSFGISGTNAHVILEEAPAARGREPRRAAGGRRRPAVPWLLSGRTRDGAAGAGRAAARRTCRRSRSWTPLDVGYSLATTRAHFEHRAVVVGADRDGLLAGLAALAAGESAAGVRGTGRAGPGGPRSCSPGRARSGWGWARSCTTAFPVFAAALDEVCAVLDPRAGPVRCGRCCPLEDGDAGPDGVHAAGAVRGRGGAVPAGRSRWGVRPDFLLGHSIGELAAAHVAGVLVAGGRVRAGGRARPADAGAAGRRRRWSRCRRPRTRSCRRWRPSPAGWRSPR